ncbi:nicotinate phosphoribosyltransferase [Sandaracinus amylolyticus]|nr:nicotinate phosphoribosyltransferase [Sandaracinus amylolyticus]
MEGSNLLLGTDSYKVTHWRQYPPGTTRVSSFLESRGGVYPSVVFFGLQYLLDRHFAGVVVTEDRIAEAREIFAAHFGDPTLFHEAGWRHVLDAHGGRLPVEIRAVPEGTVVPVSNVLMTIENTDPRVPWLTNYLESLLLQVWYPCTVATQSREMRRTITAHLEKTGTPSLVGFELHDFGLRGSTSHESAAIGGAAHLVSFEGTDTIPALLLARRHYGEPMAGFSIPAAEHSTITSWGRDRESSAYRNMLESYPRGLVAVVSDSYDVYRACEQLWGRELRELVLSRDGTLVVRPDSGHPPEVVCRVLEILGRAFGTAINAKGYRVLDPHVRVIQGDGIDPVMIAEILAAMSERGWSADNVAFGSGGALLQKVHRDTQNLAIKCSAVEIDGAWRPVMKDPVTDPGKRSKSGRLALVREAGAFRTVARGDSGHPGDLLEPVFRDGEILRRQTLSDIRRRALEG